MHSCSQPGLACLTHVPLGCASGSHGRRAGRSSQPCMQCRASPILPPKQLFVGSFPLPTHGPCRLVLMPPVCSLHCSHQDLDPSGVFLRTGSVPLSSTHKPSKEWPCLNLLTLACGSYRTAFCAMERVTHISEPLHIAVSRSSSLLIFVYSHCCFLAQGHFLQESFSTSSPSDAGFVLLLPAPCSLPTQCGAGYIVIYWGYIYI